MLIALVMGYVLAAAAGIVAVWNLRFALHWRRQYEKLTREGLQDQRTIRDLRAENERLKRGWRKVGGRG